jgi:flagellar biosynthetic protein FliR
MIEAERGLLQSSIIHHPSQGVFAMLLGFALILTRVSAFFLVLPVFAWQTIPVRIKVALVVLLSVFFYAVTPARIQPGETSTLTAITLLAGEAVYGLALGLIISLLFSAVQISARIIEQQMGMTMAEIVDPVTGEEVSPLSSLLETIFILLFLSANGHHLFLLVLSKSYAAFPPGAIPTVERLAGGVIATSSAMFVACLRLAAPMLAAFLILMVALALLARLVPEMNILFISMPVQVGLGMFLAAVFLPFLAEFVSEMSVWMARLLPLK